MLATLNGRIQTRLFMILVIGGLWALLISPALPGAGTTEAKYQAMYAILVIVAVLGIGWETVYHGLQQFRWEKDWPTLGPDPQPADAVARTGVLPWAEHVSVAAFVVGFGTTWLVTWLFVNGPMRVLSVHWRFRGGRLI